MIVNYIIQWLVRGTHRSGPSAILAAVPLLTIPVNGNGHDGGLGAHSCPSKGPSHFWPEFFCPRTGLFSPQIQSHAMT